MTRVIYKFCKLNSNKIYHYTISNINRKYWYWKVKGSLPTTSLSVINRVKMMIFAVYFIVIFAWQNWQINCPFLVAGITGFLHLGLGQGSFCWRIRRLSVAILLLLKLEVIFNIYSCGKGLLKRLDQLIYVDYREEFLFLNRKVMSQKPEGVRTKSRTLFIVWPVFGHTKQHR